VGLLFFGKPQLSKAVVDHYHARGYKTINFSMYNPFADINIGHRVDPDEWVALFRTLSFCITDRFHGTVFCLREGIPFVSIEPFQPKTLLNSKIYSHLKEFDLIDPCYQDTYNARFSVSELLATCDNLERNWSEEFSTKIQHLVRAKNEHQIKFLRKICTEILSAIKE
jgi:polysaccharide pyruvyl transferase WcaK-like protein